jgi:hypothetical protein
MYFNKLEIEIECKIMKSYLVFGYSNQNIQCTIIFMMGFHATFSWLHCK